MAADVASTEEETVRRAPLAQQPTTREALSAELAHEILNPLNCALLQLAVLRRRLEVPGWAPETVEPVAALVERSLRRLEGLVNDFLAGVQPRAGDPSPGTPDLRCQGLAVTLLAAHAGGEGLTISLHIAGGQVPEPGTASPPANGRT